MTSLSISKNSESPTSIKKIKEKVKKIQHVVNKQGKYGYYLLIDDEIKLIAKGNNKRDLEQVVFSKIAQKRSTIGSFIYLVEVYINEKYIDKPIKIVPGPLHLKIKQYTISPHFELIHKADFTDGALFYTNDDILDNGFHFTDIKRLIKEVNDRRILITNMLGIRALKVLNNKRYKN
jgi:hypothetical protein